MLLLRSLESGGDWFGFFTSLSCFVGVESLFLVREQGAVFQIQELLQQSVSMVLPGHPSARLGVSWERLLENAPAGIINVIRY